MKISPCRMPLFNIFMVSATLLYDVFGVDGDEIKSVSLKEGKSLILNTDLTHIQRKDKILWLFGLNSTIALIHKNDINTKHGFKIFGNRLKMDNQTGSLTITNIRITDSGLYKLNICRNERQSSRIFNVTVYGSLSSNRYSTLNNNSTNKNQSPPKLSPEPRHHNFILIPIVMILLALAAMKLYTKYRCDAGKEGIV